MAHSHPTTLHLLCGRIAAGKSTLARQLAARPRSLLISQDEWMSRLYPAEVRTIDDFARLTQRFRAVAGPLAVDILRQDVSVVLDCPANTAKWRAWMRTIYTEAGVMHELHVLDVPDAVCRERLRLRNAGGQHAYEVSEATYDVFMAGYAPPTQDEGFNIVVHALAPP